ncbi:MAG: L-seryl-tRNA(Sec) selenium transferase [Acidobacteriota bacterium]
MNPTLSNSIRLIPSVDQLLEHPEVAKLISQTSRSLVVARLRLTLSHIRQILTSTIEKPMTRADLEAWILSELAKDLKELTQPRLKRVINATGVILHTNLGRAPLSDFARQRVAEIAGGYSNIEYDLKRGTRGKRDVFPEIPLKHLLGCDRAVVVNNNAAAVFLILNTLAADGEVLISRGELIEIGDSFRIPDILRKSGASLREVGTTNRTYLKDYQSAITEQTRLILRVHPSNFRVVGFSCRPSLPELTGLSASAGIPLVEDLGSGALDDLSSWGLTEEPQPSASLAAGVSLVCFSGDKLLGGPQCGIIAGSGELVQRIRENPLFRTMRVDKLTLAALEGTLLSYLEGREWSEIPALSLISLPKEELMMRAQKIVEQASSFALQLKVVTGQSRVGGGSTPDQGLPTVLISITSREFEVQNIEAQLRKAPTPVIARIERDQVLIDLRTVLPQEDTLVVESLKTVGSGSAEVEKPSQKR